MLTREAKEQYYGGDAPGVPTYMGPEVLRDFETYSAASDVWSLGCVIAFFMRNALKCMLICLNNKQQFGSILKLISTTQQDDNFVLERGLLNQSMNSCTLYSVQG